jgi:hypothetical protein
LLRQGRYFLLAPKRNDRSPLRPVRDDNKNSHRAETEYGLRRKGHLSWRRWAAKTPGPGSLGPSVRQPSPRLKSAWTLLGCVASNLITAGAVFLPVNRFSPRVIGGLLQTLENALVSLI